MSNWSWYLPTDWCPTLQPPQLRNLHQGFFSFFIRLFFSFTLKRLLQSNSSLNGWDVVATNQLNEPFRRSPQCATSVRWISTFFFFLACFTLKADSQFPRWLKSPNFETSNWDSRVCQRASRLCTKQNSPISWLLSLRLLRESSKDSPSHFCEPP